MIEVIDDTQYEPDEQFYVKLSLVGKNKAHQDVVLGRISIMEVTILNDDGKLREESKSTNISVNYV